LISLFDIIVGDVVLVVVGADESVGEDDVVVVVVCATPASGTASRLEPITNPASKSRVLKNFVPFIQSP
jgi:hypothetical protein